MSTFTRWFCSACTREWVDAWQWAPTQGCPACASPAIGRVEFTPAIPGLDIPRERVAVQPPPEPICVDSDENRLLAMGFE